MEKHELIGKAMSGVPEMHYNIINNVCTMWLVSNTFRIEHKLEDFKGQTFYNSREVHKILNNFYKLVKEDNSEVYVIYEQNYDMVNITEVINAKEIGSYITSFILKSTNPSWFVSYIINDFYVNIMYRNPETGVESRESINCTKLKIKQ